MDVFEMRVCIHALQQMDHVNTSTIHSVVSADFFWYKAGCDVAVHVH